MFLRSGKSGLFFRALISPFMGLWRFMHVDVVFKSFLMLMLSLKAVLMLWLWFNSCFPPSSSCREKTSLPEVVRCSKISTRIGQVMSRVNGALGYLNHHFQYFPNSVSTSVTYLEYHLATKWISIFTNLATNNCWFLQYLHAISHPMAGFFVGHGLCTASFVPLQPSRCRGAFLSWSWMSACAWSTHEPSCSMLQQPDSNKHYS